MVQKMKEKSIQQRISTIQNNNEYENKSDLRSLVQVCH